MVPVTAEERVDALHAAVRAQRDQGDVGVPDELRARRGVAELDGDALEPRRGELGERVADDIGVQGGGVPSPWASTPTATPGTSCFSRRAGSCSPIHADTSPRLVMEAS